MEETYYFYGLEGHPDRYIFRSQEIVMTNDDGLLLTSDPYDSIFCTTDMLYPSDEGTILSGYDGPFVFYDHPAEEEAKALLTEYIQTQIETLEAQLKGLRLICSEMNPTIHM